MQRTVKGVEVTLAKVELKDGNITASNLVAEKYANVTEEKAETKATKKHRGYATLKTTKFNKLYYLPDEVFFEHAIEIPEGMSVNEYLKANNMEADEVDETEG